MVRIVIETLTDKGKLAVEKHQRETEALPEEARKEWSRICEEEWFNNWYVLDLVNEFRHGGKLIKVEPRAIMLKIKKAMRKNGAKEFFDYEIRQERGEEE